MARKVVVYSTPTCPYCIRTKQFLEDNGVVFTDYDVSSDRAKAQEMMKRSGQMGVPVIDIDGELIIGFDRDRIRAALGF